jgi:hypothetical protein
VETESVLIELNLKSLLQIQKENISVMEKSDLKRARHAELDIRELTVISDMERPGSDSLVLTLRHQNKRLLGKLYRKAEVDKHNLMEVVRQEMAVTEVATHPFLPQFYTIYEDERVVMKITELA